VLDSMLASRKCPDPVLIFIHQPKAGGVTLSHVIRRHFHPETVVEIQGDSPKTIQQSVDSLRALTGEQKRRIRCLMGHVPYGIHEFLPCTASYITILRNPIDRVISHYCYLRERIPAIRRSIEDDDQDDYLTAQSIIFSKNPTIDAYIEWQRSLGLNNLQTRFLISPRGDEWNRIGRSFLPLDSESVELAKQNLQENFLVVGIQERYDETLLFLKRRLGWRNVYYWRDNVTRNRVSETDLATDLVKTIRNDNQCDCELWSFANELLDKELGPTTTSFSVELQFFRKWNRWIGPTLRAVEVARSKVRLRSRFRKMLGCARYDV
jgi:hypothetical protein